MQIFAIANNIHTQTSHPRRHKLNDQTNNRNTNQESNGGRSREVTEVGMLQPQVVGFG